MLLPSPPARRTDHLLTQPDISCPDDIPKKLLDNGYESRLQMSRLIYELVISPIKTMRSGEFEAAKAGFSRTHSSVSGAIDRRLLRGRGLWINVLRVFLRRSEDARLHPAWVNSL
jgi:hypothetical protein